jgi:sugar fermentation stimulation protein A
VTATILIHSPLISGRLLKRKRFILSVKTRDKVVKAFLPNTGRLSKILKPGGKLLLKPVSLRKSSPFDVLVAYDGRVPVVVDSRIPNLLVREALNKRKIPEFQHYTRVSSEVKVGASRLDFRLENRDTCFLEVKGVTMVEHGIAMYPDAPTERGRRHLRLLSSLLEKGNECALLFIATRPDVNAFTVNKAIDPAFAQLLQESRKLGVKVLCYASRYHQNKITLTHKLVNLEA